jgi:hypothetical protein
LPLDRAVVLEISDEVLEARETLVVVGLQLGHVLVVDREALAPVGSDRHTAGEDAPYVEEALLLEVQDLDEAGDVSDDDRQRDPEFVP